MLCSAFFPSSFSRFSRALLVGFALGGILNGSTAQAQQTATPTPQSLPDASASASAILLGKTLGGRLVNCPSGLSLPKALCLYAPHAVETAKPLIAGAFNMASEWQVSGKASRLTPKTDQAILLAPLSDKESLVVINPVALPVIKGAVKGAGYLLESDLAGLIEVKALGGGKYRLSTTGRPALTVTVGHTLATRAGGGTVTLPQAPLTDGKQLIFPLVGVGAFGCTLSGNKVITISCGKESLGVRPIVFEK